MYNRKILVHISNQNNKLLYVIFKFQQSKLSFWTDILLQSQQKKLVIHNIQNKSQISISIRVQFQGCKILIQFDEVKKKNNNQQPGGATSSTNGAGFGRFTRACYTNFGSIQLSLTADSCVVCSYFCSGGWYLFFLTKGFYVGGWLVPCHLTLLQFYFKLI